MNSTILGLISDTHGLLRPEAKSALGGSRAIIHAGDIGKRQVLEELKSIAPVFAVRGNVDTESWASSIPLTEVVELEGTLIYVLHDLKQLDLVPAAARFKIVVSGHTHKAGSHWANNVLYVNPGSAGPKRFNLPITIARLDLARLPWEVEFVELRAG